MDRYNPERDISENFLAQVGDWIAASGEVLVILRYLRAAGQKDYFFCRSPAEVLKLVETLPVGTDTIVFRHPKLPLRGVSSPSLLEAARARIAEGEEYLIVLLDPPLPSAFRATGWTGDNHSDLTEDLTEVFGRRVAVGCLPDFTGSDNDAMISASKGGVDGPR